MSDAEMREVSCFSDALFRAPLNGRDDQNLATEADVYVNANLPVSEQKWRKFDRSLLKT
jgi:hypothetical protein